MASRALTLAVIAFLLLSLAAFGYYAGSSSRTTSSTCSSSSSSTTTTAVNISFYTTAAVRFYGSLMSPLGLLTDYPGSHTIWLADDQALDYFALLGLYYAIESSTALSLAQQVNNSITNWGGFGKYWNPVFEVFGDYNTTLDVCGTDQTINVTQGYTIDATVFTSCPGFQYSLFADLLAYHVLLDIHEENNAAAESEFGQLSEWGADGFEIWTSAPQAMDLLPSGRRTVISWSRLENRPMFG
jgi:hypothetical protein